MLVGKGSQKGFTCDSSQIRCKDKFCTSDFHPGLSNVLSQIGPQHLLGSPRPGRWNFPNSVYTTIYNRSSSFDHAMPLETTNLGYVYKTWNRTEHSSVESEEVSCFATYHFRTGSRPTVAKCFFCFFFRIDMN